VLVAFARLGSTVKVFLKGIDRLRNILFVRMVVGGLARNRLAATREVVGTPTVMEPVHGYTIVFK
jgi:hypothetical protein